MQPPRRPASFRRLDVEAAWSRFDGGEVMHLLLVDPSRRCWVVGPGGAGSPKSREEACVEWAARMVESGVRT
jgi:hypothetical protein